MNINRRDLLTRSSMALGGLAANLSSSPSPSQAQESIPGAEAWNKDQGIRKKDERLLNIGGVFGLWSHMSSSWWRYFNPPEGYARTTGMRISHLWCIDPEAAERLGKRYDAEVVDTYDGMVGKVDGMFIDDFFVTPLMPDLSLPYLEAGIPCYFDRPMASSMDGVMKVIDASKHSGTPFMVASAYEYLKEIEVARLRMKDIGDITAYEARNAGSNIYMYALHGLWFALKIMGVDVERIGCRTDNPVGGRSITTLDHNRDGKLFYGSMHQSRFKNIMTSVRAYGTNGDFDVTCVTDGRPWHHDQFTYLEMLYAIERMIRTKKAPETNEYVEAKMRIFLSMLNSVYAKDGAMVEVSSLPRSWDAGVPKGFTRSYPDELVGKYRKVLR
ncbi:Gfo/Idh/MocA family protein [Candidatus Latescibacterota bacterium]